MDYRCVTAFAILLVAGGFSGCASSSSQTSADSPPAEEREVEVEPSPDLDGTLWVQSSAEYRAAARQSYAVASLRLTQALESPEWTAALEQTSQENYADKPPAVIVDVDETVLDNSAYQARLVRSGETYDSETWNAWCREKKAPAVPGALDFATFAAEKGATVFYVTNRDHAVEEATRQNLERLGFPLAEDRDVILTKHEKENWDSDKTPRRKMVARDFRVVLLIGDNLGDFVGGTEVPADQRRAKVDEHAERWGQSWIVLPNPVYGDWEATVFDFEWSLERDELIERKRRALDPMQESGDDE